MLVCQQLLTLFLDGLLHTILMQMPGSGLPEEQHDEKRRREHYQVRHHAHSDLRRAEREWSEGDGPCARLLGHQAVPHGVHQHREVEQRHAGRDALYSREAAARGPQEHGEPEVAVREVLPGAGVEEVLELEHLLATRHGEQAVNLKWKASAASDWKWYDHTMMMMMMMIGV